MGLFLQISEYLQDSINAGRLYAGAIAVIYTRTLLPSRITFLAFSNSTPSFLACSTASSHIQGSLRSQVLLGFSLLVATNIKSCGSAKVGLSCTNFISSPEMSINWSHSGFKGPTFKKRSFENLFKDTSIF